ncbi:MAG: DUF4388 domain-containing protein [Chitinispirillaceae bacterium]
MVLSGTLKEFILADVFHLLTQQKITGKLFLSDGQSEGAIIFKSGMIVGAEKDEETLQNKLFNFLVDVKKKSPEHLNTLFTSHEGNLNGLCAALVDRNLMTVKEIKTFADNCVEDITCSLLMWKSGVYRFNSLRSVIPLACSTVSISSENIIMEGMRRVDEWNRMVDKINEDSVFVKTDRSAPEAAELDIFCKPEEYIYTLLDGSSSVSSIVRSSCLSEYKVYESLHMLLQTQRIIPLPPKISQTIQAAIDRKELEGTSSSGTKTALSSLFTIGFVGLILLFGIAFKSFLMSDITSESRRKRSELFFSQTQEKIVNASLFHQALTGEEDSGPEELKKAGLLTGHDLSPSNSFKD